MLEHALSYLSRGWSVIPLVPRGKRAAVPWEEFQVRRASEDEVRNWYQRFPNMNLGIVTGVISNLFVLDADGVEADEYLKGKEMPPTPQSTTGKGSHHYYEYPGFHVKTCARPIPGIDLRGDGGYVVAPPSVHPTGSVYSWAISLKDCGPQPPGAWLVKLLRSLDKQIKDSQTSATINLFERDLSGDDWYVSGLRGLPEGEGRNSMATRLLGRWLGLGHDDKESWELLKSWNLRNQPPLTEKELSTIAQSIIKADRSSRIAKQLATGEVNAYSVSLPVDRETVINSLNQAFENIHIKRLMKYRSTPPRYTIVTDVGEFSVGSIDDLIQQTRFRSHLAAYTDRMLKVFKANAWHNIAELLLKACEEIEVGDEATDQGSLSGWISMYFSDNKPVEEERIETDRPFIKDGSIYVNLTHMRSYLANRVHEIVKQKDLAVMLRRSGCIKDSIWTKTRSLRVWKLSEELVEKSK